MDNKDFKNNLKKLTNDEFPKVLDTYLIAVKRGQSISSLIGLVSIWMTRGMYSLEKGNYPDAVDEANEAQNWLNEYKRRIEKREV